MIRRMQNTGPDRHLNRESGKLLYPDLWIPLALLALLLLGAIKYASDTRKHRLVVDERDVLQQKLLESTQQVEANAGEISTLKADLDNTQSNLEQVQTEYDEKTAALEASDARLKALAAIPNGTVQLRDAVNSLQRERAQLKDQLNSANRKIAQLGRQREGWLQTRDIHWQRIGDLKTERNAALDIVEQNSIENHSLNTELKQVKSELEAANGHIKRFNRQREGWLQTRDLHWQRIGELKSQRNAAREINEQNDSLSDDLQQVKNELESANRQIALSNRQREGWLQTRDLHWQRIGDLKSQKKQASEAVAMLSEQNNSQTAELNEVKAELAAAGEQIKLFNRQREGWLQTRDLHWQRIGQLKSEKNAAMQAIQAGESNGEQVNEVTALALVTSQRNELRDQVARSQQSIAALESQLARLSVDAAATTAVNPQSERTTAAVVQRSATDLSNLVSQELAAAGVPDINVSTVDDKSAVAISLEAGRLFDSGGVVSLSREGSQMLSKVARVLENKPGLRLDIEGHTDSKPLGPKMRERFTSNQALSTARAETVKTYLSLVSDIAPESMSATGYAASRPVADNETSEGRSLNRRVDLILRSIVD